VGRAQRTGTKSKTPELEEERGRLARLPSDATLGAATAKSAKIRIECCRRSPAVRGPSSKLGEGGGTEKKRLCFSGNKSDKIMEGGVKVPSCPLGFCSSPKKEGKETEPGTPLSCFERAMPAGLKKSSAAALSLSCVSAWPGTPKQRKPGFSRRLKVRLRRPGEIYSKGNYSISWGVAATVARYVSAEDAGERRDYPSDPPGKQPVMSSRLQ